MASLCLPCVGIWLSSSGSPSCRRRMIRHCNADRALRITGILSDLVGFARRLCLLRDAQEQAALGMAERALVQEH